MEIKDMEISKIVMKNKDGISNVRTDKIDEHSLMESIKQHGLMQPPGVHISNGENILCWGHRRINACSKLGWKKVPVVVIEEDMDEEEYLIMNLTENIQRKDLRPVEMGKVFRQLKNDYEYSDAELGVKFGVPKSMIKTYIELFEKTPEDYKHKIQARGKKLKQSGLSPSIANAIARMQLNKEEKNFLYGYAIKEALTIADLRLLYEMLSRGYTLSNALNMRQRYIYRHVSILFNKEEYKKLVESKVSITSLVHKLLRDYEPKLVPKL